MVGRLVEQQHVGVLRQCPRDRGAAAFAARRRLRVAAQVDAELVGDRLRLVPGRGVAAGKHIVEQGRAAFHPRLLLEQHDMRARHDGAAALVAVDAAGDQLEQRRLARAVAADQRQPVALADIEVQAAEQPAMALDETEIFVSEDRCSHARHLGARDGPGKLPPAEACVQGLFNARTLCHLP